MESDKYYCTLCIPKDPSVVQIGCRILFGPMTLDGQKDENILISIDQNT